METARVTLRADAGPGIGVGHVARCLALGRGFLQAGLTDVELLVGGEPETASVMLENGGLPWRGLDGEEPEATLRLLRRHRENRPGQPRRREILVVDSVLAKGSWWPVLRAAGPTLAIFDDSLRLGPFECDAVININAGTRADDYRRTGTRALLLLGPEYFPLSHHYLETPPRKAEAIGRLEHVLVVLGGTDVQRLAPLAVRGLRAALGALGRGTVRVLAPGLRTGEIESAWGPSSTGAGEGPRLEVTPPQPSLAPLLAGTDLAVISGGGLKYEAAYMGVPSLILPQNEEQERVSESFEAAGAGRRIRWSSKDDLADAVSLAVVDLAGDEEKLAGMARAGPRLVDGRGARRIAEALLSLQAQYP